MKVKNGKIVEIEESMLQKLWLARGYDDCFSFVDFENYWESHTNGKIVRDK